MEWVKLSRYTTMVMKRKIQPSNDGENNVVAATIFDLDATVAELRHQNQTLQQQETKMNWEYREKE
ncbi:VWA domain-containing protein [Sesbania bispinosa]|nr:VWA domain-containing protein [Sesbania bispinosa]